MSEFVTESAETLLSGILAAGWPDGRHDGFPTRRVAEMIRNHLVASGAVRPVAEVRAEAESLHEELLRAGTDADQLRAVIFGLAEDVARLKRACRQEHPPKMGSPTRDWPAGTETQHSDGARCVLLNDGDYALVAPPDPDRAALAKEGGDRG